MIEFPEITALPWAGAVTDWMKSGWGEPSSLSLASTAMVTAWPVVVLAESSTAVGGTGTAMPSRNHAVAGMACLVMPGPSHWRLIEWLAAVAWR